MTDRYLSNAVNRIDAKGRVSVPAHFRAVLQKSGYRDLYALRTLDTPSMDVGGPDLLDRYEARIAAEDPLFGLSDDISFFCHGDGTFLKLDQDGRILITDFIREHTGIDAEVTFLGRGNFFQMWEPERLRAHGAEVRSRLIRLRQSAASARQAGESE
jgi:MraZ protein